MIKIVEITKIKNDEGQPINRACQIIITNGAITWLWNVGGLPLVGDLQAILDSREAEFWAEANVAQIPVPKYTTVKLEARQFLVDNPNAK